MTLQGEYKSNTGRASDFRKLKHERIDLKHVIQTVKWNLKQFTDKCQFLGQFCEPKRNLRGLLSHTVTSLKLDAP